MDSVHAEGSIGQRHHAGGKLPLRDENPVAAGLLTGSYNKMTPERRNRTEELFESEVERAPDERSALNHRLGVTPASPYLDILFVNLLRRVGLGP